MKKLLAAVIAAWACSAAAQDVTGNLIYTTTNPPPTGSVYSWSGFILTDSGGGGLSGGDIPAYNPYVNQFMWGYMPGTINYSLGVGSVLQGTGLQIIGLQYGLEYFNQDFSRGSLSATWTLRDGTNKLLESYYHTFGYTTEGWTKFDMTKTFASPYSLASVATLGFTATGTDDRFWAGYYGPQIRDLYARLMYGVDPCATNVLSSPTCAGFAEAMARLSPPAPTLQPVATSPTVTVEPVTTTSVVEIAPTTTTTATPTTTTAVATAVPSAVPLTTSTTSPAPRSTTSNSAAVGLAMRAVSEAQATTNSVLAQAQESAVASQGSDSGSNNDSTGGMAVTAGSALGSGLTISFGWQPPGAFATPGSTMTLGASTVNTAAAATTESTDQSTAETSPTSTRALAAMSNPQMSGQEENTPAPGVSTVRNVAPPSELAGGPDIGAMAVAPQGFNAYLTAQLRDAAFYPPREVYRGQRNVDNARALRGLGSDARHQEMVDQQYRK